MVEPKERVLLVLRAYYVEHGYAYGGGMGPVQIARESSIADMDELWGALDDLVSEGIVQRRKCQAISYGLSGRERVQLIEEHQLARAWEETAGCFYPNDPRYGEVPHAYRDARLERGAGELAV